MIPLSTSTCFIMAIISGLCVANLYYCQPLLTLMKQSFECTDGAISWIVSLCQIGYALGMCFFISLGDLIERRKLILIFLRFSIVSLATLSYAPTLLWAYISSFLIGLTTMTPHLTVTLAASLAEERKRGQAVGTIMSGIALGLLLGRTFSGFLGPILGWRLLYKITSGIMGITLIAVYLTYPRFTARFQGSYFELQKSIWSLVRNQPVLREAMIFGALLFGAFNAFWVNLIHLMDSDTFRLGAPGVGAFALLGSTSVIFSTLSGKLVDRINPRIVTGGAIAIMSLGFLILLRWWHSLFAISIGVILIDIASPCGSVSNQTRIYSLPIATTSRSRLNAAYMTAYFVGGALGSTLSAWAWIYYQWAGVCYVALVLLGLATIHYFAGKTRKLNEQAL